MFYFLVSSVVIETICPKVWAKIPPQNEKSTLPVDVRRSKTPLLKFTIREFKIR